MQERQEERASIVPLKYTYFADTDAKAPKQSSLGKFYIASTMIDDYSEGKFRLCEKGRHWWMCFTAESAEMKEEKKYKQIAHAASLAQIRCYKG